MKYFISICLFIGLNNFVFPQQKQIQISDKHTFEPLVSATVKYSTNKVAISNQKGIVFLPNTTENISITFLGYNEQFFVLNTNLNNETVFLEQSNQSLETVVVTASKIQQKRSGSPTAIYKLTAKTLDETKATSIFEAINKTPGVMMANLNNEQHMMSIRLPISTSAYYLYLEDGVPVRPLGVFNHNALLEFNQFTVNSIEIVKGPTSSIYGPEAVGGTINFISNKPTAKPMLKLGIQGDQFNYKRLQYAISTSLGKWGVYIGGLYSDQKNGWITSSNYTKNAHFGKLTYQLNNKINFEITNSYSNYDTQTSGNVDSVAFYNRKYVATTDFTYRKSYALRSKLGANFNWNNQSSTAINMFYRDNDLGQNPAYAIRWTSGASTARGEINNNSFQSKGLTIQHNQNFKFLNSKLVLGGLYDNSPNDYWSYQIDLNAQLRADKKSVEKYTITKERPEIGIANYNAEIINKAIYGQLEMDLLPKLKLTTGLRFDIMAFDFTNNLDTNKVTKKLTTGNKSYQEVTSKIGLNYKLSNRNGIYANFSQGFSPPGLTAIFRKRPTPDAEGNLFYYNLKPAKFNNYEIGSWTSLYDKKIFLEGNIYLLNGQNELLNIRQQDNSFDYQSAGKTTHKGIELSVGYKILNNLNFRFGGTYSKHIYDQFILSTRSTDVTKNVNGNSMPSAPQYIWNTEINWEPIKNARIALEWQHVGKSFQNQINTYEYKGYELVNLRLGYTWKNIEFYSNIMNLTDALYASNVSRGNNLTDRSNFTPAAPRNFVMGIQINLFKK